MTIETAPTTGTAEERAALPPRRVAADIALLAQRNLRKVTRNPQILLFTTVQPLMQLFLFVFVFGSVISIPGIGYKDFVVPAVLVQTMTFAGMTSGVGIATDMQTGGVERLRSLPIARSAFLVGRTASDSARLGVQAVLLTLSGLAVGFRFHRGFLPALGMVAVVVLFGLALSTFSAWVGLSVKSPEAVQAAVFIPILPLVFTSSAFAPVERLPGWMQDFARASPLTAAVDTARALALDDERLRAVGGAHLGSSALHFTLWVIAIVGVFTALAVRKYRTG